MHLLKVCMFQMKQVLLTFKSLCCHKFLKMPLDSCLMLKLHSFDLIEMRTSPILSFLPFFFFKVASEIQGLRTVEIKKVSGEFPKNSNRKQLVISYSTEARLYPKSFRLLCSLETLIRGFVLLLLKLNDLKGIC